MVRMAAPSSSPLTITARSAGATCLEGLVRCAHPRLHVRRVRVDRLRLPGEPTPWNGTDSGAKGTWPSPKNSYFGIIDTAGLPKDSYYLYQSLWNEDVNTLHMLPAWNSDVVKKDGQNKVDVAVYTDAAAVELFFTPKVPPSAIRWVRRPSRPRPPRAAFPIRSTRAMAPTPVTISIATCTSPGRSPMPTAPSPPRHTTPRARRSTPRRGRVARA